MRRLGFGMLWFIVLTFVSPLFVIQATRAAMARPTISADLEQRLAQHKSARVIISLRDPVQLKASSAQRAPAVAHAQQAVLDQLSGPDFKLLRRYSHIPSLAGVITVNGLRRLQAHPQ